MIDRYFIYIYFWLMSRKDINFYSDVLVPKADRFVSPNQRSIRTSTRSDIYFLIFFKTVLSLLYVAYLWSAVVENLGEKHIWEPKTKKKTVLLFEKKFWGRGGFQNPGNIWPLSYIAWPRLRAVVMVAAIMSVPGKYLYLIIAIKGEGGEG